MTNCYVIYRKFYELHDRKPLTHYAFIEKIALAWLKPSEFWQTAAKENSKRPSRTTSTIVSSVATAASCTTVSGSVKARRAIKIN